MNNLISSIDQSFERLLRWVYPAGLFLVLLYMSRPDEFNEVKSIEYPWSLIVAGLVGGAVVYLLQAYVWNQVLSIVALWSHYDVNAYPPGTEPRGCLRGLAQRMNPWTRAIRRRWEATPDRVGLYLNYAWATCHASSLTGWLTLLFFFAKAGNSMFAAPKGWMVLIPASYGTEESILIPQRRSWKSKGLSSPVNLPQYQVVHRLLFLSVK